MKPSKGPMSGGKAEAGRRNSMWAMNLRELSEALREVADIVQWQQDVIDDFHAYSHRFGFSAGSNVYKNVLGDALRHRGITLEQFRKEAKR